MRKGLLAFALAMLFIGFTACPAPQKGVSAELQNGVIKVTVPASMKGSLKMTTQSEAIAVPGTATEDTSYYAFAVESTATDSKNDSTWTADGLTEATKINSSLLGGEFKISDAIDVFTVTQNPKEGSTTGEKTVKVAFTAKAEKTLPTKVKAAIVAYTDDSAEEEVYKAELAEKTLAESAITIEYTPANNTKYKVVVVDGENKASYVSEDLADEEIEPVITAPTADVKNGIVKLAFPSNEVDLYYFANSSATGVKVASDAAKDVYLQAVVSTAEQKLNNALYSQTNSATDATVIDAGKLAVEFKKFTKLASITVGEADTDKTETTKKSFTVTLTPATESAVIAKTDFKYAVFQATDAEKLSTAYAQTLAELAETDTITSNAFDLTYTPVAGKDCYLIILENGSNVSDIQKITVKAAAEQSGS